MNNSLLEDFNRDGYVVLPEKIPAEIIDAINDAYDNAAHNREKILLRKGGEYFHPGPLGIIGRRKRVIDFYAANHAALQAVLAKPITDFLQTLYNEAPLAFQALLFQFGSRQNLHQDTAYVVTDTPDKLAASWIALEDIQPGSGELIYYKGSHHINMSFNNGEKIWDRQQDSIKDNHLYTATLSDHCEELGLKKEIFRAKKGEILIWHAGLVHGGSAVDEDDRDKTRKSLVTHYCPSSDTPNYFNIKNSITHKQGFANGFYASRHYDVRPESDNPFPIYTGGKNIAAK